MSNRGSISSVRIVQIAPLPVGWHSDEWNRVIGIALVEITDQYECVWSDAFFLAEDLSLVGAPDEIHYGAHFTSPDDKTFAIYGGPDWEPRD